MKFIPPRAFVRQTKVSLSGGLRRYDRLSKNSMQESICIHSMWADIEDEHDSVPDDILELDDDSHLGDDANYDVVQPQSVHRLMHRGHATLSNYMHCHIHGVDINTGYINDGRYITPLHVPSVVVGHTHQRIAVCDTGTTKLALLVTTSYMVSLMFQLECKHRFGSRGLAEALTYIDTQMETDDLRPPGFIMGVNVDLESDSPLTLGHKEFPVRYENVTLDIVEGSHRYAVPMSCPNKRYLAPCGLGSTMVSNSVVLMFPDVNQYLIKPEQRQPHEHEIGFLCQSSSSSSAALKGLVRYVCTGTVCRCYNMGIGKVMRDLHGKLLDRECACEDATVSISIAGLSYMICSACLCTIQQTLDAASCISPHVPTLHNNTGTDHYIISFCTGTLMRIASDGKWCNTRQRSNYDGLEYHSVLSPCASLTPYPCNINVTRLGLSNIYLQQAICAPYCNYMPGMLFVPQYSERPILMPDFISSADHMIANGADSMPGLNLRVVFMNMLLTYEDGMVMSRTASERFRYTAEVHRIVSAHDKSIPDQSTRIEPYSTYWWQCHFSGVVKSVNQIDPHRVRLVITCECYPVNGDKFTTLHGQKGVITILSDHNMPYVNGYPAEIVIGTSSILKRGTVSQLLEAAYTQYAIEYMASNSHITYNDAYLHFSQEINKPHCYLTNILSKFECDVIINEDVVVRKVYTIGSSIAEKRNVRVNYGTIRVMQSCFLASHRMSATASMSSASAKNMNTSSSTGGSKSLGEMEVTQLIASGLTHSIAELSDRSDMHVVDVCNDCRLISDMCTCLHKGIDTQRMVFPLDTIKYAYASRIALGLNTKFI